MERAKQPPAIRRQRILELVESSEFIVPNDIARTLGVSGETIRRDLMTLEQSGSLKRVHGGAIHERVGSTEPDRASRIAFRRAEKKQIAAVAVRMIQPSDSLFLDVGTTVEAIADALPRSFRGTVVTNSLHVAFLLGDRDDITLDVIGGRLRAGEFTTAGPDAIEQAARFHADLAFIGAGGVSVDGGVTDYSIDDAAVKRAMIAHATRAFVVASSDKIGKRALRSVCAVAEVAGIITDTGVEAAAAQEFRAAGTPLITS